MSAIRFASFGTADRRIRQRVSVLGIQDARTGAGVADVLAMVEERAAREMCIGEQLYR